jgi:hypothetical protein
MTHNYSVDYLRKAAFVDELNNCLKTLPLEQMTEEIKLVIQYLEKRIKEIDARYK